MDAVKFIQEHKRMCKSSKICEGCPFDQTGDCIEGIKNIANPEEYVDYVETWSNEHSLVTNEDRFVEMFGFAIKTTDERLSEWFKQEYKGVK